MKQKLKLSRGKQTAVFLALTALLLCLFWGFMGYPLPSEEMEFRRLERQCGVPPTQMVVHIEKKMEREETYMPQRRWIENSAAQYVGVGTGYAVSGAVRCRGLTEGTKLELWPLEEQPGLVKLIPLLMPFQEWRGLDEFKASYDGIVLVDVPEGAAEVELTLYNGETPMTDRMEALPDGGWLLTYSRQEGSGYWNSDILRKLPYRLTVFDKGGTVLHTQSGTVPDSWR